MKTVKVVKISTLLELLNEDSKDKYSLEIISCCYEDEDAFQDNIVRIFITSNKNIKGIKFSNYLWETWYITMDDGSEKQLLPSNVNKDDITVERIGNKYLSEPVSVLKGEYIVIDYSLEKWLKHFNINVEDITEQIEEEGYFRGILRLEERELNYLVQLLKNEDGSNFKLLEKIQQCSNNLKYTS